MTTLRPWVGECPGSAGLEESLRRIVLRSPTKQKTSEDSQARPSGNFCRCGQLCATSVENWFRLPGKPLGVKKVLKQIATQDCQLSILFLSKFCENVVELGHKTNPPKTPR